jgi:bifunctional enzyme CysN/CysC
MLYDSKQIFQDQMEALERSAQLRGEENVNLALLTDGLRAEREQGITIDVAYRYFSTPKRKFIIADTPGHEQYTRNMVTGASTAQLAIILIDVRNGVITQSRRHGFIASLLGIPHVLVCVNKMDLVDYSQDAFDQVVADYKEFAEKLDVHDISFIPISALEGDNVVNKSERTPWFEGPSVLHHLENVTISADRNLVDFRFPVQYVVRPHQDFRGFAGQVTSGTVKKGQEIVALPSGQQSRIRDIATYDGSLEEAFSPQSVVIQLENEIDISRGDMIVRPHNVPSVSNEIEAVLCWMDGTKNLSRTTHYVLQHTTRRVTAYVDELLYEIDVNTMHRRKAETLRLNEIGRVKLSTAQPIFFDSYRNNRGTGSFILIDPATNLTVAAGMIRSAAADLDALRERAQEEASPQTASSDVSWEASTVTLEDREKRNGHKALCIWFTGLSGSGKSTIARDLEKRLFDEGIQVTRLDGDNVRHGLNGDLGFSAQDRKENIRRVGHAAKLLYDAGQVVLCTFISPYADDRKRVRELYPEGRFIEIYVKCDLDEAKRRDPKGLYDRAERGEIKNFTGVSAPYEEPKDAELTIDTTNLSAEEALRQVYGYLEDAGYRVRP